MSVRVSYKKQAILSIMLLLVLLTLLAGVAELYYFFIPNCHYGTSAASMHLDIFERNQICIDLRKVEHTRESGYPQHIPNQHFQTININNLGFRGQDLSAQKPDNTYRIFFLGGSTAFGYGSTSDDTAIPGYLQTMYDARNLPFEVEVINAGISGVTSYTEYNMIKDRLLGMEPDLFIIYDGWNGAFKHPDNPDIPNESYQRIMSGELTLDEYIDEYESKRKESAFRDLYRYAGIVRLAVDIRDNLFASDSFQRPISDNTAIDEKVSIWTDRWNEICMIGNERGFDVMVIVQPILGSGNYTLNESEKELYERRNIEAIIEHIAGYANALPRLDSCTATADMRGVLDDVDRPIFYDAGHLNNYGNKIIASAIFEESFPIVKDWGASTKTADKDVRFG